MRLIFKSPSIPSVSTARANSHFEFPTASRNRGAKDATVKANACQTAMSPVVGRHEMMVAGKTPL